MSQLVVRSWLLRTTSTATLAVPLMVFGVFVAMSNARFLSPYWLDLSAKATIPVLFVAPGFAALAAWDAARWRRLVSLAVRSWPEIWVRHLLLVATATALTFAVTLGLLYLREPPVTGGPAWDVLALEVGITVAYASTGFAVGRFLPPLTGAPLSFAVVWLWVAYTPAIQPFWLRNVTGNIGLSCCSNSQQVAPSAMVAVALIGSSLFVGAWWVLARPAWVSVAAGVAVVAFAVRAASQLVADLGTEPVVDRTGPQVCTTYEGDRFCAWPEDAALLSDAVPVLKKTVGRLRTAGFDLPRQFREDEEVAGGYQPPIPVEGLAQAWLDTLVGTPIKKAANDAFINASRLRAQLARSPEKQWEWYLRAMTAMRHCEPMS